MNKKLSLLLSVVIFSAVIPCVSQDNNLFSHIVGEYKVILLSETQSENNTKILTGATSEMIRETMPDGSCKSAVNAFLIKTSDKTYLIDTGFGKNLWTNLSAVNVLPEQVDVVVLTHMHGDHIGGLIKDGKVGFPNAKLIVSDREQRHWVDNVKEEKAIRILKMYGDKVEVITPEILSKKENDGIYFIEAYGHTPGHIVCLVQSQGEKLLIWGDLTHAMAIQMPYPEVAVVYDTDKDMAVSTRKKLLEFVSENKIAIAGMHIAYPSMGSVEKNNKGGYIFIPLKGR